jgi:hypothetical protein
LSDIPESTAPESTAPESGAHEPDLRRPSALACVVIAALVLSFAVAAWALVAKFERASYVGKLIDGSVQFSASEAARQDDRVSGAGVATSLTLLVTAAVFITWFALLVKRLYPGRSERFRYRSGWSIGGWFIPLANFVIPKQMVDDAWRAAGDRARSVPAVFHLWWALYVVSSVTLATGNEIASHTQEASTLATGDHIAGTGEGLFAIAAILGIVVVVLLDLAARRASPMPEHATWPQTSWPQPAPQAATWPTPAPAPPPAMVFNPPPGWPAPPPGWVPAPGWQPDPSWPPAPADWTYWVPVHPG